MGHSALWCAGNPQRDLIDVCDISEPVYDSRRKTVIESGPFQVVPSIFLDDSEVKNVDIVFLRFLYHIAVPVGTSQVLNAPSGRVGDQYVRGFAMQLRIVRLPGVDAS
jgi:hypothetical protein